MNICHWRLVDWMAARIRRYTLPHCGSPSCTLCVGAHRAYEPSMTSDGWVMHREDQRWERVQESLTTEAMWSGKLPVE